MEGSGQWDELLKILSFPGTDETLRMAPDEVITRINRKIKNSYIRTIGGGRREIPLQRGLVCDDRRLLFPIVDNVPILLVDEALSLDAMEDKL